jgi:hypothetical protein
VAELTPIPSAQRPAEPGYQPLSGYAVAAVVVAGLFAVILVALVVVGLTSNRTPLTYQVLALAVAGVVLAVVGRSHIRNSEGTRTGLRLANAAWWVCVLGGAGFGAFLLANEFVLRAESRRKADGFFEALREGKEQEAFEQYVLPPELRGRADPGTPEFETVYTPAGYPLFAGHRLLQAFRRNGTNVRYEHVGARDVGQEGEGFKATHTYRITVAEGVFDVQLKLVAAEPKSGKPQWHIQAGQAFGITEPSWDHFSEYGRLVIESEQEAGDFARRWMADLSGGRPGLAHLYLLPLPDREKGTAVRHMAAFMGGGAVFALPPPGGTDQEFDQLLKAGFFRRDAAGNVLSGPKASELRALWASPNVGPASAARRGPMAGATADIGTFAVGPEGVTVGVPADLMFGRNYQQFMPATVGIVCSDPAIVSALTAARDKGPGAKADGSVSLRTLPPRDWRIAWFQTTMEAPPMPGGPGAGRGGPGGPGG